MIIPPQFSNLLNMKKYIFRIIAVVILAVCAFYIAKDYIVEANSEHILYTNFNELVEKKLIDEVKITKEKLFFVVDGHECYTENPDSPLLKEFLLKNGVTVKQPDSATETFSFIFDLLFYIFFFGIIVVAFRKFISPNTFKVVTKTGVTFDDVIGMDSLKKDTLKIIDIMKHPQEYAKKGIRLPKGIILEGDPGNGKTLFARALAGEGKINFIPAKATDFESMFMAIGPLKVKLLFSKARRKYPCIVFIDEFDGIGTKRNYSGSAIETENTRIVTALLNELDGFIKNNRILVIAATNSIQALDPALIRPGRFDAKYSVPYPDTAAREKLIELYTKDKSAGADCDVQTLAKLFNGFSCAKIESCTAGDPAADSKRRGSAIPPTCFRR